MEAISFCPKCPRVFNRVKDLKYHLLRPCKLECGICKITFSWQTSLTKHENTFHEEQFRYRIENGPIVYICDLCSRQFKRGPDFHRHLEKHREQKGYECDVCKKTFAYKTSLKKHSINHDKQQWLKCQECPKTFARKESLKIHQENHERDRNMQCNKCNIEFQDKPSLMLHLRGHVAKVEYQCDLCLKLYYSLSGLIQHKKVHLGIERFNCDFCPYTSNSKKQIVRHTSSHNKKSKGKFNDVDDDQSLIQNKLGHVDSKPIVCALCSKVFDKPSKLKSHSNNACEMRFQCKLCSEKFRTHSNLVNHEKGHIEEEEELDCDFCPYKSNIKLTMEKHIEKHRERIRKREELIKTNPLYKHLYFQV